MTALMLIQQLLALWKSNRGQNTDTELLVSINSFIVWTPFLETALQLSLFETDIDATLLREEKLKQENFDGTVTHNFTMFRWYAMSTTPMLRKQILLTDSRCVHLRIFFFFVFNKNMMNMMPSQYNIGITNE